MCAKSQTMKKGARRSVICYNHHSATYERLHTNCRDHHLGRAVGALHETIDLWCIKQTGRRRGKNKRKIGFAENEWR